MIRKALKLVLSHTLKPYLKHIYLRSDRTFVHDNLKLKVKAGIFHPGLFFSSKLFRDFIKTLPLANRKILDVGCGSGILSLTAAEMGGRVTAVDINPSAVENTRQNAARNRLPLTCFQSDLFHRVRDRFDFVFVNPPYYPQNPASEADHAWYCGASFQFFERFFIRVHEYCRPGCDIYMVLSDGCDLRRIRRIAADKGYRLTREREVPLLLETNYIFKIRPSSS